MIEAVMIWNEPNNKSHWDPELDPEFSAYAAMTRVASEAIAGEAPQLPIVMGGMSPIDPLFVLNMQSKGALDGLRCSCRAWFSAGLESLADPRLAGQAR